MHEVTDHQNQISDGQDFQRFSVPQKPSSCKNRFIPFFCAPLKRVMGAEVGLQQRHNPTTLLTWAVHLLTRNECTVKLLGVYEQVRAPV